MWFTLLVAWLLAWVPHGIIGIGFATAGGNAPSIELYGEWASNWPGLTQLVASGGILLGHFGLSVLGLAITGHELLRRRSASAQERESPRPR